MGDHSTATRPERALLVGVSLPHIPLWDAEDSLDELSRLADTATLIEAGRVMQARERVDPTYYIGKGKADEIKELAKDLEADMLVFDNDLSPAQMRNLEKRTDMRVLDRSAVILDIFSRHAQTRTAQVQVELAQLNYLLPRLTRMWTHLSRQAGGGAIRGMGSAGVRGPGETQLETDRRMIRRQINALQAKLDRIGKQMETSRKGRSDIFKVALVGYTNAGKSTLMRALSEADATLSLVPKLVNELRFDEQKMAAAVTEDTLATDQAVDLARGGMPFRDAYKRIAASGLSSDAPAGARAQASIAARVSFGSSGNLALDRIAARLARLEELLSKLGGLIPAP